MKTKLLIVSALMALLAAGSAYADKKSKKADHPMLKITCDQYLDYEPEDLSRVYYWYDAYSWLNWDNPIIEDDDYVVWNANLVTYCTDNKGDLVVDAIQAID